MSKYQRYNLNATQRPTFYMSSVLLKAIETRSKQEHTSRSGFVASILTFLLLSPIGQQLQENARVNNLTLAQELEKTLALFEQQLIQKQVSQLAVTCQRSSDQMLIYLALLGLRVYQEGERLDRNAGALN